MAEQTRKSFSVRIFLQDGRADGVRIVSRSKWSGRGLVIPRAALAAELGRTELAAPGVYLLTGPVAAAERPQLLVGAADPVCDGLAHCGASHRAWSTALIFTCKENSLSFAQCQSIAAGLLQHALSAGRAEVSAVGCGGPVRLNSTEEAAADSFLDYMLGLYPLLGVTVFGCKLD